MGKLSIRSYQPELLDGEDIPFADIRLNMQELNTINTLLGGHHITTSGLQQMLMSMTAVPNPLVICEIGCGGGDNLHALYKWCRKKKIEVRFIGIDIKATCIEFARQQYPALPAEWIVSDYAAVNFTEKPHVIFSSLFCHHFTAAALVPMLQWMRLNAQAGFFINDLHRHPLAWYSIRLLTALFSKSYLVKNDAPLSVARGFRKAEWEALLTRAAITHFSVRWRWAFRHLITCTT